MSLIELFWLVYDGLGGRPGLLLGESSVGRGMSA